jgi:hypothetical protein
MCFDWDLICSNRQCCKHYPGCFISDWGCDKLERPKKIVPGACYGCDKKKAKVIYQCYGGKPDHRKDTFQFEQPAVGRYSSFTLKGPVTEYHPRAPEKNGSYAHWPPGTNLPIRKANPERSDTPGNSTTRIPTPTSTVASPLAAAPSGHHVTTQANATHAPNSFVSGVIVNR